MNRFQRAVTKHSVNAVLRVSAWISKSQVLGSVGKSCFTWAAQRRLKQVRVDTPKSLLELGQTWQKAFPSAKQVPITHCDGDTVYAEIHTPCPLRGSENLQACYRMMAYDRHFVEHFGASFTVLESQAEGSVQVCKVAMQFKHNAETTLIPAHQRSERAVEVIARG